MARWQSANVLRIAKEGKRLWQFGLRGETPNLSREEKKLLTEPLPAGMVSKDWQTLYKPRLNIAWLPADKVFLRVVQLPPAESFAETTSMVELQLEKLSPLPTAQIVWTFELLPRTGTQIEQTAIVVIIARNFVEDFLGKLEGQSYLADRLEVPFIDQLLTTKAETDGVWIYPGSGADEDNCLVAWWYLGVLQSVSLLHLPAPEERGVFIREQIAQMAWAGELEGWITSTPRRFVVADSATAAVWQPMLQEGIEQRVEVVAPLPEGTLAQLTARRASRENASVSLVPAEYTTRYRQQFVDRIWMRSLFAVVIFYLLCVFVYLALVQFMDYKVSKVEQDARNLAGSYTNTLRMRDMVRVMQDQLNLQFASLDCYKAVSEKLPETVTLDTFNFSKGRVLRISGTAPREAQGKLTEFSDELRAMTVNGEAMFASVTTPSSVLRGNDVAWNMDLVLAKGESE